jgi:hypothetical protein
VQAVAEITVARHFADRGVSSVSSLSLYLKKIQACNILPLNSSPGLVQLSQTHRYRNVFVMASHV